MASPFLFVLFKALLVQSWLGVLFRRDDRRPWLYALVVADLLWMTWVLHRMRGGMHMTLRQPALFLWMLVHLALGASAAVETLARWLPWPRAIRWGGGSLVALGVTFTTWGLVEAYGPPVRREVTLVFPDLPPAFDGYRILLISDLHAGPYAGARTLRQWGRAVQATEADLLVGAGDFISYWPVEAEALRAPFQGIAPPDGKVGVLGNHDRYRTSTEVSRRLEAQGWIMLDDESLTLSRGPDRLNLLGMAHPEEERGFPGPTWRSRPAPGGFTVGLVHSPAYWPFLRHAGARLTLAGHTHGGQINLDPFLNVARINVGYVTGTYTEGRDQLYVTAGLGCTALPFRFRCRPEVVRITLRRG